MDTDAIYTAAVLQLGPVPRLDDPIPSPDGRLHNTPIFDYQHNLVLIFERAGLLHGIEHYSDQHAWSDSRRQRLQHFFEWYFAHADR